MVRHELAQLILGELGMLDSLTVYLNEENGL
jgi:hypothetical protein